MLYRLSDWQSALLPFRIVQCRNPSKAAAELSAALHAALLVLLVALPLLCLALAWQWAALLLVKECS